MYGTMETAIAQFEKEKHEAEQQQKAELHR